MYFDTFLSEFCSLKTRARFCLLLKDIDLMPRGYQFLEDYDVGQRMTVEEMGATFELYDSYVKLVHHTVSAGGPAVCDIVEKLKIVEYAIHPPCVVREGKLCVCEGKERPCFTVYDTNEVVVIKDGVMYTV